MQLVIPDFASHASQPITRRTGLPDAPILVVTSEPSWDLRPMSESAERFFFELARKEGLSKSQFQIVSLPETFPAARDYERRSAMEQAQDRASLLEIISKSGAQILCPLDDASLWALTGKQSIHKWHLSILEANYQGRPFKVIPLLHPDYIFRSYTEAPFLIFGFGRIRDELRKGTAVEHVSRDLHIRPTFAQAMEWLRTCYSATHLSIDIETVPDYITCCAFAISPTQAMSIPLGPDDWPEDELHKLWCAIEHVLAGPALKVFQNFIYDTTYFSKYGCRVKNLWLDTMLAQRYLYAELPADLGTLGRLYTREPFWKDEADEGPGTDSYYIYNCKDAALTLEIAFEMEKSLVARGLWDSFHTNVMRMSQASTEMCWQGLPIDSARRETLTLENTTKVESLITQLNSHVEPLMGKPLNPRSPKQVKEYLAAKRYRIPVKKGKETSDITALLKLQTRYPNDPTLPLLIEISETNKLISSFLKPHPYPDGRLRFSFNIHGAETGRWSCSKDAFGEGLNVQTLPSGLKSMIQAPPEWVFVEADLKQADARYVAWDAPEPTLIKFFTEGRDIHRFVAAQPEMFNKPEDQVTKDERQLGKKTGHAANYGMRGATHSDACLREMGLILSPDRADQMLEGYHRLFPGIRLRQRRITDEVRRTKTLRTPLGRERLFFGRFDDSLCREAFAYCPQSVVSDIVNRLIMFSHAHRNPEKHIHLNQVHDAYWCMVRQDYLDEFLTIVRAQHEWNPTLDLPGGKLLIPIELKVGENMGALHDVEV